MIKLSGQQIQALAEKIAGEINAETAKKNKEIENKRIAFYTKKLALKENKTIKEMLDFHIEKRTYNAKSIVNEYIREKYQSEYNKLEEECSTRAQSNDIRNEIILETIQCENLDEIVKKIKSKYQ